MSNFTPELKKTLPLDESYYRNPSYGLPTPETAMLEPSKWKLIPFFTDFEWEWRKRLLNATQQETIEIWDTLLNPQNYGLLNRQIGRAHV